MKRFNLLMIVVVLLVLGSCKSSRDMEKKELLSIGELVTTLDTAVLVLPIQAKISDLTNFFESTFGEFYFGEPEDDLIVKAELRQGLEISVDGDSLRYQIPMDLHITQKTFLGSIKAYGSINLSLQSKYDIDDQWNLVTSTRIISHEWIEKPKANVSVIRLSIESLSDRLILKNRAELATNIDSQIANNVNLRKSINDIWFRLRSPMEVSKDYKVWLQLKPISLSISRLQQSKEKVVVYIKAMVTPKVKVGSRPTEFKLDSIPNFTWLPNDTSGYLIPIRMSIPDQEIADLANVFLADEIYDLGNKQIKVKNVIIDRIDDIWMVNMTIYGDVSGDIQMQGKPKYDNRKNQVILDEFDYAIESRNLILKSSAVLFKQKVERRLLDQLNEIIQLRRKDLLEALDDQLLKTNQNQWLGLENEIDRFSIYDLGLDDEGMWVYILIGGECKATFKYQVPSP